MNRWHVGSDPLDWFRSSTAAASVIIQASSVADPCAEVLPCRVQVRLRGGASPAGPTQATSPVRFAREVQLWQHPRVGAAPRYRYGSNCSIWPDVLFLTELRSIVPGHEKEVHSPP
jgi:hypothetical protein